MMKNFFRLLAIVSIIQFTCGGVAQANDYYSNFFDNRIQHSLYLSIPFHQERFKKGEAPLRFGYAANFYRGSSFNNPFSNNTRDLRAQLLKIEYSSLNRTKLHFGGMPLAQLDRDGFHLGQDADSNDSNGTSTTTVIALGAIIVGGAFFATKSNTQSAPAQCTPSPVPGAPPCP